MSRVRDPDPAVPARLTRICSGRSTAFGLEDRLVDGDLVEDLLPERGLVALADALEVAERTVETHAAMNHPRASLGERHEVDLEDAVVARRLPGECPPRWTRLVV